jgi:hypothetical protein
MFSVSFIFLVFCKLLKENCVFKVSDKCFLVLFHTPLFIFVTPLALLISIHFTCFVCFVINRPLHHVLIEGAIGHEVKRSY